MREGSQSLEKPNIQLLENKIRKLRAPKKSLQEKQKTLLIIFIALKLKRVPAVKK